MNTRTLLPALMLVFIAIGASAQGLSLRSELRKMVSSKNVTAKLSERKGIDTDGDHPTAMWGQAGARWSVERYEFSMPLTGKIVNSRSETDNLLAPVRKAYWDDRVMPYFFAAVEDDSPGAFTVRFSNQLPPAKIGDDTLSTSRLVISATAPNGQNEIAGLAWREDKAAGMLYGTVTIIERDPSFIKTTMEQPDEKIDIRTLPENLRRLRFYADRYRPEGPRGGGAPIIKAVVLVVSDIIQTGDDYQRAMAKQILDEMISITPPSPNPTTTDTYGDARDNEKILLTLIGRLDATYRAHSRQSPDIFTIDGERDNGLKDIGYYISFADTPEQLAAAPTELIKIEGQTFYFQKQLDGIKYGRVRSLLRDGRVASGYMDYLFVPGETLHLNVHPKSCDNEGSTQFYQDYATALLLLAELSNNSVHKKEFDENGKRIGIHDKNILDFLTINKDHPGFFVSLFESKQMVSPETRRAAYNLLSDKQKQSHLGAFLRRFLDHDE